MNEKLINLLIESKVIKNKYFVIILLWFSIFLLLYLLILMLWTFIDIGFINYSNVWIISNLLLAFVSMISILWIIYFAKGWKDEIIDKDILKEKVFKTMDILKWKKAKISTLNFNLVNSKNVSNYKNFVKRIYKNKDIYEDEDIKILVWINLNDNHLYYTFWKDKDLVFVNDFHEYLNLKKIKNKVFENNPWLFLIKDKYLDAEITEEELADKIYNYMKYIDDFLKTKEEKETT